MSYEKSPSKYTTPVAESTQLDASPRASPSRPSFLWGGKYTPRNNKPGSVQSHPSPSALNRSMPSPRLSSLDSKTHRDTLSHGLVSRINKYQELSAQKSRPISNRTYSRQGDFPNVILEKSAISIKPQHASSPTIARIGVGAPLRLSNQASSRSSIFSTGKNYGDTAPIVPAKTVGAAGTSGAATSNGNAATSRDDEPIVPTGGEYDTNPTRSVLDELVEISRKRTRCDDLDGEFMKKSKADRSPTTVRQPSPPPNHVTKRGRDRTSPSYYSPSAEARKKRYRNNDILSSLSSSMHLNPPQSVRTTPDFDFEGDKSSSKSVQDKMAVRGRPPLRSENFEKNGVDIPAAPSVVQNNHEAAPPPAPVQREQMPRVQKLTLFNKIYEPSVGAASNGRNDDYQSDLDESSSADYDDSPISFVKPKTKTSTVFKVNKNGTSNKLADLLSVLREDDAHDEVDNSVKTDKATPHESLVVVSSSGATLSSGEKTTVTFSTATTTSVLSLPSPTTVTVPETHKNKNDTSTAAAAAESTEAIRSTPPATIATSTAANVTTLPKSVSVPSFGLPTKPTISFALNATTASATTSSTVSPATASESTPRLGGFSFAATMTTPSPFTAAKSDAGLSDASKKPEITLPTSAPLPAFSFGKPATPVTTASTASTASTAAPVVTEAAKPAPIAGGFSFSASSAPKTVESGITFGVAPNPTIATPTTTAQSPATFTFGKSVNGLSATASSAPTFAAPSFSFTATTTAALAAVAPASTMTASSATPTFNFGAPKSTGLSFGAPTPATTTTAPSMPGSTFTFGATAPAAASTTTSNLFGAKVDSTTALTLSTQTPAANLFGTPTTAAPIAGFGAKSTSFNSVATTTTTIPSFGASFNQSSASASTTTTASSPFGTASTTTTFNSPAATPVFGSFTAVANTNTATPAFGSNTPFGMAAVTTAAPTPTPNLFGSTTAAAPQKTESVFGSASTPAAAPAFGASSFGVPSAFERAPASAPFGSSSQTPNTAAANPFGGSSGSTPAFNFAAKVASPFGAPATGAAATEVKPAFSFNATPNASATSVGGFNSVPSASAFGTPGPAAAASSFTFGASTNDVSKATPTFAAPAFGAAVGAPSQSAPASGVFAFGQTAPATTTAATGGIFGSTTTNASSAFTFGQTANPPAANSAFAAPSNNASAPFTFNTGANSNATAAPAFGGSAFSFGATSNGADSSTTANSAMFGAPASAPAPFAFGAPAAAGIAAPATNAFQFNAQQPAPPNLFSIGPGNPPPKNRPIRQATRRINK